MPVEPQWIDQEKTLIYITLEGKLDGNDFLNADPEISALLDSVDHPVDIIIDYSAQVYFSPDYAATTGQIKGMEHVNIRSVIFVGNRLAWELFNLYTQQFRDVAFKYAYAPTFEEGRALVRSSRDGKRRTAYRPDFPELN
jgi:hypothetical protein